MQFFFLLVVLCCYSRKAVQGQLVLNNVFNCTIDSVFDEGVTNSSQCEPDGSLGRCTFRNAIAFCNDHLDNFIAHKCNVIFPSGGQTIVLNETFGELIIWRAVGTLVLEGNGCAVTTSLYSGMRFLAMFDPLSVAGQLDFHLMDLHISHFGNDTVIGGAMRIRDTKGSSFRNVTFARNHAESGGALSMERNQNMTFIDVTFIGNSGSGDGGGIELSRNNNDFEFRRCLFVNNVATGSNSDENPGRGGGLFLDTSNEDIRLVDCLLEYNTALRGASLCVNDRNVRVSFLRTTFQHNVAELHSGGVYAIYDNTDMTFANSSFVNNSASDGPAVRIWSGNDRFAVLGCNFSNNHASSEGGAIFIYSDNRGLTFLRSTFESNTAVQSGGAIYVDSGNTGFVFEDCLFSGNSAERGGAIYVGSVNGEFHFTRVTVQNNVATGYGGGISFVSLNNQLRFTDSAFLGNEGSTGGGVHFAMDNTLVVLERTLFSGNRAALYGGGLYLGQEHDTVRLTDVNVFANKADSGAGIYIGQFNFDIIVKNANISNNEAHKQGGGMFSSAYDMQMYDSIVSGNKADSSAGMILTFGDDHALTDKKLKLMGCSITDNQASMYGGIYMAHGSNINIEKCLFRNNSAALSDSGGLAIADSINCSITETIFEDNRASYQGGALIMTDTSNVQLENVIFSGNSAEVGGCVVFQNIAGSQLHSLVFVNNTAGLQGGALWLDNSHASATEAVFTNNVAVTGNGAAIYSTASTLFLSFSNFTGNRAARGAGAVYWRYHSGMTEPTGLRDDTNIFDLNTALYGDDWATEGTQVVLSNTTLYITDYAAVAPPLQAFVKDFYNETVTTESTAYMEIGNLFEDDCYGSTGYVSGDIIERVVQGVATFLNLQPNCAPGFSMEVTVAANMPTTQAVLNLDFRECEKGEFYGERICQPCANGSYSFTDPTGMELNDITSSICEACPTQAVQCFKDTIVLKNGYWRISESSQSILECPLDSVSCIGGSLYGDGLCGEGYSEVLCAVCEDGYTLKSSSQTCEECSSEQVFFNPLLLIVLFLVVSTGSFLFISWKQMGKIDTFDHFVYFNLLKLRILTARSGTDSTETIQNLREIRLSFQTRLSIYGTFFQIIAVLPYVLDVKLPDTFSSMLYGLSNFLNLSVSQSSILSCEISEDYDFIDSLLVDTLMPLGILFVLIVSYRIHSFILLRQSKSNGKSDIQNVIVWIKVRGNYVKSFLIYSVIILPYVSVQIFKTFSCQDVDTEDNTSGTDLFLRADYSISCSTPRYDFALAWASCAIVIYIIMLPLCYLYLLAQAKTEIARFNASGIGIEEVIVNEKLQPIYFLFRKYRSQYWYWEVVELYFRVSITGFLVLIRPGSFLQVEVGFLVIFLYAKLFQLCDPYKHDKMQALKVITLWQLFFVFHVAFLIRGDELTLESEKTAIILFFISFSCLLFDSMLSLLQYLAGKYALFGSVMLHLPSYLFPTSNYLSEIRKSEALRRGVKEFKTKELAKAVSSRGAGQLVPQAHKEARQVTVGDNNNNDGGGDDNAAAVEMAETISPLYKARRHTHDDE